MSYLTVVIRLLGVIQCLRIFDMISHLTIVIPFARRHTMFKNIQYITLDYYNTFARRHTMLLLFLLVSLCFVKNA